MIITRLTGGLGNQMFQYAAGFALATRHRTAHKLDLAWFNADTPRKPHERYGLHAFRITAQIATARDVDELIRRGMSRRGRWSIAAARLLGLKNQLRRHNPPGAARYDPAFRFDPDFEIYPDGTYLHGNWQSEKYFRAVASKLCEQFSLRDPLPAPIHELVQDLSCAESVCVHVRRGDYVSDPAYVQTHAELDADYYRRALELIRSRVGSVKPFVFSDDLPGARESFQRAGVAAEFVAEPPELGAHHTLQLMSAARHFVIANSTLSWWAAWLGRQPGSAIVAPEPWFAAGDRDGRDIVPENWIRLPRQA